ncbi:MAG: cytochrome c oxidase subunit 3, partial [Planctomycetaceae bacterium]
MSATVEPSTATAEHQGDDHHGDEHGHHEPFLAHHFESWQQQFDAGKLGLWLFLCQEILFFSGLFCAYSVYRMLHPEVFQYADQFLSVPHGAANTIVLLFSSLTMAWGVRCAMLGQKRGLIACVSITLFCASLFLGVKAYEYTEKFHAQLIWAGADPLQVSPGGVQAVPPSLLHLDPKDRSVGEELERKLTHSLNQIEFGVGVVGLLALAAAVGIYFFDREKLGLIVTAGAIALSAIAFIVGAIGSMGIHHWAHDASHDSHAAEHSEHAAADEPAHGTADAPAPE